MSIVNHRDTYYQLIIKGADNCKKLSALKAQF